MFSKTFNSSSLSRNNRSGMIKKVGLASPDFGTSEPTAQPAQVDFKIASDYSLKTCESM